MALLWFCSIGCKIVFFPPFPVLLFAYLFHLYFKAHLLVSPLIMNEAGIDWFTVIGALVFYLVILVIGIVASRRKVRGSNVAIDQTAAETVIVGHRDFGWFIGICTMAATWIGGGAISGSSERAFTSGMLSGAVIPIGYAFSLLLGGLIFAEKMRAANYITSLEPYQIKYGKKLGIIFVTPAFVSEVICVGIVLTSLGSTLQVVTNIGANLSAIVSALVAVSYTLCGGIFSVAYTDIVQLAFMVFGVIIAIPFALDNEAAGSLSENPADWILGQNEHANGYDMSELYSDIDTILSLAIGGITWQCYFQRVLSARSPKVAKFLSIWGFVFCVAFAFPPLFIGAIARTAGKSP